MFAGLVDPLPARVRELLDGSDLLISPAVQLELQYLFEIRRTAEPAKMVLESLGREVGLKVCDLPFPDVVEIALSLDWTRDPFDRLLVSQAELRRTPLITKDRHIRDYFPRAVWN